MLQKLNLRISQAHLYTLFLVVLAFGVVAVLADIWNANWRWDDTQILLFALQHGPGEYFFRPEVWRTLTAANLTPWLSLSYDIDAALFSLRPLPFYLHQLLAVLAVAAALFYCLRLWTRPGAALLGCLLFLVGAPALSITQALANRHYVEGALFCLLALSLFVRHLRDPDRRLLAGGAVLYLLSVTAKEVYVPLVVLLPFLPEGHWRHRLRASLPFIAIAGLYTLWRGYMLGSFGGGYATTGSLFSLQFMVDALATYLSFPELLAGVGWPLAVVVYLALLTIYLWDRRRVPYVLILTAALVLAPLAPLAQTPGIPVADRYLFLPWIAFSFSVAYLLDRVLGRWPLAGAPQTGSAMVIVTIFVSLLGSQGWRVFNEFSELGADFDAQAAFVLNNDDSVAFVPSEILTSSFWFYRGLRDLKASHMNLGSAPVAVIDSIYLDDSLERLFAWDSDCHCLRDDSESIADRLARHSANTRSDAPLSLELSYRDDVFSWVVGPYADGQWHFLSDQMGGIAPAPASGQLRVYVAEGSELYLRYTSPEGWSTYSDPIVILQQAEPIRWSR